MTSQWLLDDGVITADLTGREIPFSNNSRFVDGDITTYLTNKNAGGESYRPRGARVNVLGFDQRFPG